MLFRVDIRFYRGSIEVIKGLGFPKIRAPAIRIRVFLGLYWGLPSQGNYHVSGSAKRSMVKL